MNLFIIIATIINAIILFVNIMTSNDEKLMFKLLEERVDILQKSVLECLDQINEIEKENDFEETKKLNGVE